MSTYHYQCQYCFCTVSMWEEDDGTDDHYGGATGDCGCRSSESNSCDYENDCCDDWDD